MKVVFLNGPPEAGKDMLADCLVRTNFSDWEHPSLKFKFADALKIATHALYLSFGNVRPSIENTPYVQVYGPNWFADSLDEPTPDFFGRTPRQVYEITHKKFMMGFGALDITVFTHALFGLFIDSKTIIPWDDKKHYVGVLKADFFEQSKNLRSHLFDGFSPRETYIEISENKIKPLFDDKKFFGKVLVNRLRQLPEQNTMVFISDSGFYDEAIPVIEYCEAKNCFQFRIHAEERGKTFVGDSRSYFILPVTNLDIENNIPGEHGEFCLSAAKIIGMWCAGEL